MVFHIRLESAVCRRCFLCVLVVFSASLSGQQQACAAKNVILMISDGAGYNTWLATSMFQGKVGQQVYDQPGWLHLSCSTYTLTRSGKPTGNEEQDPSLVYYPSKAWNADSSGDKPGDYIGYRYLTTMYTDSAAAATALATGRKTYNGSINWSNSDRPMLGETIAEIAKSQHKSVGVITSVIWSQATPAGLGGAHNVSRNNFVQIANEMLEADWLDVIMGAGHPEFDDNGQLLAADRKRNYKNVGGRDTWQSLKAGERQWKLIETKADFKALGNGPTPKKVLGVAQTASTFQENRGRGKTAITPYNKRTAEQLPSPFETPLNENVPSLAVMTRAAINCLDDNPNGFFLMIEGGAVDWANHANEPDRMIEEQIDFLAAVNAVVEWIETHGGWENTLLILTADHETGLIWGPNSAKVPFEPIVDRGPDKMPGMTYHSHGHSNSLVPLYVRGPGIAYFADLAKAKDETAAEKWKCSGLFVDNTDVFKVMRAEVESTGSSARH